MPGTTKKIFREEYNRLKKVFEKIMQPKQKQALPQLVLQPARIPPAGNNPAFVPKAYGTTAGTKNI